MMMGPSPPKAWRACWGYWRFSLHISCGLIPLWTALLSIIIVIIVVIRISKFVIVIIIISIMIFIPLIVIILAIIVIIVINLNMRSFEIIGCLTRNQHHHLRANIILKVNIFWWTRAVRVTNRSECVRNVFLSTAPSLRCGVEPIVKVLMMRVWMALLWWCSA